MEHYSIKGMSCAACSARVEKAVSGVAGVTECSVNLLTNSMTVKGTADSKAIEKAVRNAGYGIKKKGAEKSESDEAAEKAAYLVSCFFSDSDVFFDGSYDVGISSAVVV